MDFSAIYTQIEPIVRLLTPIIPAIVLILTCIKGYLKIKAGANGALGATAELKKTPALLSDVIKNAMPDSLTLDVSNLVDDKVAEMLLSFERKIDEDVLAKLKKVEEKDELILRALMCLKSLPDDLKSNMAEYLTEKPQPKTATIRLQPLVAENVKTKERLKDDVPVM